LLLVADANDVRLWDVRDVRHPVLESTLKVTADGGMAFLSDQLAVVNVRPSSVASEMELWDIANPRHPVAGGTMPNGSADLSGIYIPSRHVLAASDNTRPIINTTLWSLENIRKPSELTTKTGLNMDPNSLVGLNGDTWVALTRDDETIDLWNVSDPRKPTDTAALAVGSGSDGGLSATTSPGGWLVGSGFTPPDSSSDMVYLTQVRADGKAISNYAQLSGDPVNFTLSPDGKFLVTNFDAFDGSGFQAFDPWNTDSENPGILYPLNSDSVYGRLCSITTQIPPSSSWSKYLPATYYRPACS
jgi:hypothetical protein